MLLDLSKVLKSSITIKLKINTVALLSTDSGSLIHEIKTEDVYGDFSNEK